MTNFIITVKPNTTIEGPLDIENALATGTAQVHSERADGTFRRRHFLADGSDARAVAEWVRVQHEGQEGDEEFPTVQKRTMRSIANELHLSVAAVRRVLVDLAITEAIEDADAEDIAEFIGQIEEAEAEAASN